MENMLPRISSGKVLVSDLSRNAYENGIPWRTPDPVGQTRAALRGSFTPPDFQVLNCKPVTVTNWSIFWRSLRYPSVCCYVYYGMVKWIFH